MKASKIIFVTGASKGFGFEITKAALANGDKVVATVRSDPEKLAAAFCEYGDNLLIPVMDVTKEEEIKMAVVKAIVDFGRIDVLINNAGFGMLSAIEEASNEEVKRQYDTNVFGMLNVIRAVLPSMRLNRSGHIINFSSLFAFEAVPGWALYGSTKFAVEGISKGLAVELAPLGIHVTAVEPGRFHTDFLSKESYTLGKNVIADYKDTVGVMRNAVKTLHGKQPGDPELLAQVIVKLAHRADPPAQLPIGFDSVNMFYQSIAKSKDIIERYARIFNAPSSDKPHGLL